MPTALVTGASSGIGLYTAVGLAQAGFRVLATMRDPSRSDALQEAVSGVGAEVEVVALDVTDPEQSAAVVAAAGDLDVLVNNAGRGSVSTLEQLSDEELMGLLDVNFLAVARLTRLALPRMRARGSGRIVTVTSVGGVVGQPFADAYCAAKFAVEGLMQSLAPVAARFGVTVGVVEPAAVSSGFVGSVHHPDAYTGSEQQGDDYAVLRAAYLARSGRSFASAQPAPDAARTVVEAATSPAPRFRWQTSPTAEAFASLASSDLTGERVLGFTSTWLDEAPTEG